MYCKILRVNRYKNQGTRMIKGEATIENHNIFLVNQSITTFKKIMTEVMNPNYNKIHL